MPEPIVDPLEIPEAILICAFDCTEQNVHKCRKCDRPFCIMHANHISPNFCKDCFKDVHIIAEKFKRTFDHIADNGQLYVKTEERTRYFLDGPDWPFVTPWIDSLSDDELKSLWVFHHYIMRLIELENDTRRVENTRKLGAIPIPRLVTTTKTRSVSKVVAPETPESMRAKWVKMGIPSATIDIMLKALEQKP
jgi:hypothetical protein